MVRILICALHTRHAAYKSRPNKLLPRHQPLKNVILWAYISLSLIFGTSRQIRWTVLSYSLQLLLTTWVSFPALHRRIRCNSLTVGRSCCCRMATMAVKLLLLAVCSLALLGCSCAQEARTLQGCAALIHIPNTWAAADASNYSASINVVCQP